MILAETLHVSDHPVGRLLVDSLSGGISFQPAKPPSLLPDKPWSRVAEIKAAVTAAYSQSAKDEGHGD